MGATQTERPRRGRGFDAALVPKPFAHKSTQFKIFCHNDIPQIVISTRERTSSIYTMPNIFVQTNDDSSSEGWSDEEDIRRYEIGRNIRREKMKGGLSFYIEGHDYSGTTGLLFDMVWTTFGWKHFVQLFTPEQLWEAQLVGFYVSVSEQDIPQVHKEDVTYLTNYKAVHGLDIERPRTP